MADFFSLPSIFRKIGYSFIELQSLARIHVNYEYTVSRLGF